MRLEFNCETIHFAAYTLIHVIVGSYSQQLYYVFLLTFDPYKTKDDAEIAFDSAGPSTRQFALKFVSLQRRFEYVLSK